jgi:hypothetical protein
MINEKENEYFSAPQTLIFVKMILDCIFLASQMLIFVVKPMKQY